MLKPISELYPDPMDAWFIRSLNGYAALTEPLKEGRPVGAFLSITNARSRTGTGRAYYLHNTDYWAHGPIPHRSARFKAFSDKEAIEIANKRLAKWEKQSK